MRSCCSPTGPPIDVRVGRRPQLGRGSWRDNVFVERLWRSVKYEEVYLKAYESVAGARVFLGRYLDFYNRKRPHSSLDARTPERAYFDHLPQVAAA